MNSDHPITPPPELVLGWAHTAATLGDLATQAARWGADQARAALADHVPGATKMVEPPAAGEVAELVEGLRNVVAAYKSCHRQDNIWSLSGDRGTVRLTATLLARAADLLEALGND